MSGNTSGLMMLNAGIAGLIVAILTIMYPLFGFYFTVILSFFIFIIVRFLKMDAPLVSGIDILVYLTFIGVLIDKIAKKESFLKNCDSPVMFIYGIIIVYYVIEFFNPNSISKEIYFLIFRRFATILLFFYCAVQLFTTSERIRYFFKVIMLFSLIAAVYGIYQKWVGIPKFEMDYFLAGGDGSLGMLDDGGYRVGSIVSDVTAFGLLMSGTLIVYLVILLNHRTTFAKKILLFFSVITLALAMSYSGTRTATFMLCIEVCLYILMTSTQRKTIVFSIFFAFILGAILFGPSYGNSTINRLKSTFESEDESLKVRDVNRKFIQPYIHSHPIGGGVGTTGVVYYQYNIGHPLAGFPTDSGLLSMALEFGWIGLIIQCLAYFIALQQGIRGYYQTHNPQFRIFYLAATLFTFGYIAAQYSQIAIGQIPGGFLFYGLTAVIIRMRQIEAAQLKEKVFPI